MPEPTQLIYTDNPGAIPATFQLPPTLDLVIQSIVVRWNGAGAAGSFLPCLSVYSQDDRLVGRFHPGPTLAVADTGVVTYAPFLGRQQSSGDLGTIVGCGLWQTVANPATIPDGFVYQGPLVYDTVVFDSGGFYSAAQPSRITFQETGIYVCRTQIGYDVTVAGSFGLNIVINGAFAVGPHWKAEQQHSETGNFHSVINISAIAPFLAGDYIETWTVQKTGAARAIDPTASWFEAVKLGDSPAGTVYGL